MNVVPIVNENDTISVAELRFGDNDTLSAITAGMVNADYLFLLTDVDALYTDNPRINPESKVIHEVDDISKLKRESKFYNFIYTILLIKYLSEIEKFFN